MSTEAAVPRAGRTNRRQLIIAAATEVFAERGYEGSSLREIGERAGVMKGHLSYYFAVKDDLLFAVIDALHERFLAFADSWPERPELAEVVRGHVLLICAELPAARVSYENFRLLRSDRHDVVSAKRDDYELRLRALIAAQLLASGSTASATVTTRLVLGLLNWHYTWWQPGGSLTPEALADSVVALVDAALG